MKFWARNQSSGLIFFGCGIYIHFWISRDTFSSCGSQTGFPHRLSVSCTSSTKHLKGSRYWILSWEQLLHSYKKFINMISTSKVGSSWSMCVVLLNQMRFMMHVPNSSFKFNSYQASAHCSVSLNNGMFTTEALGTNHMVHKTVVFSTWCFSLLAYFTN